MRTRGCGKQKPRRPRVAPEEKQKSPGKTQTKSPEKPGFSGFSDTATSASVDGDFSSGSDSDDDRTFICRESEAESESEYVSGSEDEAEIRGNKGLYYNFYNKKYFIQNMKIFASKASKSFQLAYFIYLHNGKS